MMPIMLAWPFSQWGIDIVGPLPIAPGGTRFLAMAIDYFTKWVKAKLLISTTRKHMEKFVWEHIVCRFGVPHILISDNGKQFVEGTFPVFCQKLGIFQAFTLVYLPQVNRQVEAHKITPKSSNGKTPFSFVYDSGAVFPIEISIETRRIQDFDAKKNKKRCREDLDILQERRELSSIKEAYYKQKLEGYITNMFGHLPSSRVHTYFDLTTPTKQNSKERWDQHGKDLT
ncbi:reverse transcriptase domain-containing protein [Tanacetum coccineum]